MARRCIDKFVALYDAQQLKKIPVPELGKDEAIYYTPLTAAELDVIEVELPETYSGAHHNAQVVITKALDVNRKRLFSNDDIETLCQKGIISVIGRIARQMVSVESVDAIEKN